MPVSSGHETRPHFPQHRNGASPQERAAGRGLQRERSHLSPVRRPKPLARYVGGPMGLPTFGIIEAFGKVHRLIIRVVGVRSASSKVSKLIGAIAAAERDLGRRISDPGRRHGRRHRDRGIVPKIDHQPGKHRLLRGEQIEKRTISGITDGGSFVQGASRPDALMITSFHWTAAFAVPSSRLLAKAGSAPSTSARVVKPPGTDSVFTLT